MTGKKSIRAVEGKGELEEARWGGPYVKFD